MKKRHEVNLLKYQDHQKYLEQLERNNTNLKKKFVYQKLHDLYYNGVPDKYDLRGNKIKGIKPDSTKAINYLLLAHQYGDDQALLKLAKIYHNGMYNFDPKFDKAEQYYKEAINVCSDNDSTLEAQEGYRRLVQEKQKTSIYNWLNIKQKKKKNVHHEKCQNIWNPQQRSISLASIFTRLGGGSGERGGRGGREGRGGIEGRGGREGRGGGFVGLGAAIEMSINDLFRTNHRRYRHPRGVRTERADTPVVAIVTRDANPNYNDAHNTHNSQVLSTIKNSLSKIKKSTKQIFNAPQSLRDIRSFIMRRSYSDKREDALKSLDSIEKSTSPLTFCKMKEVDALNLVWNRIHNDKHNSNQSNLKDTLFNQLAEMQEHGKTVCSTGKFTRIVDTLNVVDDEVTIKPTYAINQEMMDKSAKIRTDILSKFSEDERKKLEMGTSSNQDSFDSDLKEKIRGDLKKDYVDSKILSQEKFNNEINKWIDHI